MVGIEIRVDVRPEKRDEFLQAVEALQAMTRRDREACVSQNIYQERGHQTRFLWVERWAERANLEARLESDPFRALLGAVRVLGVVSDMEVVEAADWPDADSSF